MRLKFLPPRAANSPRWPAGATLCGVRVLQARQKVLLRSEADGGAELPLLPLQRGSGGPLPAPRLHRSSGGVLTKEAKLLRGDL